MEYAKGITQRECAQHVITIVQRSHQNTRACSCTHRVFIISYLCVLSRFVTSHGLDCALGDLERAQTHIMTNRVDVLIDGRRDTPSLLSR